MGELAWGPIIMSHEAELIAAVGNSVGIHQ